MGFPSLKRWMPKIWSFTSRIVMHPRSAEAHSVYGRGPLLLCQPSERKVTCVECRVAWNNSILSIAIRHVSLVTRYSQLAAQAGLAPAQARLTGGWTTVIPLSNGKVRILCWHLHCRRV